MVDGYPRPLSNREAEILRFMLGVDDDRLDPLREQAASAVVTGMCTCSLLEIWYIEELPTEFPPATAFSPPRLEGGSNE